MKKFLGAVLTVLFAIVCVFFVTSYFIRIFNPIPTHEIVWDEKEFVRETKVGQTYCQEFTLEGKVLKGLFPVALGTKIKKADTDKYHYLFFIWKTKKFLWGKTNQLVAFGVSNSRRNI